MLAVKSLPYQTANNELNPLVYMYTIDSGEPVDTISSIIDRAGNPSYGSGPVFIEHRHTSNILVSREQDIKLGIYGVTPISDYPGMGGRIYTSDTLIHADITPSLQAAGIVDWAGFCVFGSGWVSTGTYVVRDRGFWQINAAGFDVANPVVLAGGAFPGYEVTFSDDGELSDSQIMGTVYGHFAHSYPFTGSYHSYAGFTAMDYENKGRVSTQVSPVYYNFWEGRVYDLPAIPDPLINSSYFTRAFYAAVDKLPTLDSNPIANVLDAVSTLSSFKEGYKPILSAKKAVSEAWLSYRYAYNTTCSDLRNATECILRIADVGKCITSYGVSYNGDGKYMCSISVATHCIKPQDYKTLERFINASPSLTNAWDIVPYSFIIDWFLHISEICEALDDWLKVPSLDIQEVWYSFSVTNSDDPKSRCYGRWLGRIPSMPYVSYSSASGRTICMRVADMISLLL